MPAARVLRAQKSLRLCEGGAGHMVAVQLGPLIIEWLLNKFGRSPPHSSERSAWLQLMGSIFAFEWCSTVVIISIDLD